MKILVNIIEGASASSNPELSLEKVVRSQIVKLGIDAEVNVVRSIVPGAIRRSIRWLRKQDKNAPVVLFGKSLGGVRTWRMSVKFQYCLHPRDGFILVVDPHGWQLGDGRRGIYGRGLDKLEDSEERNNVTCVFQQSHNPKGVPWQGANNIRITSGYDHMTITQSPEVMWEVRRVLREALTLCQREN